MYVSIHQGEFQQVVLKFWQKNDSFMLHVVLAAESGVDGSPYCRCSTLSICKGRVTLTVLIYFLRKTYVKASGAPHKHQTSPINNPSNDSTTNYQGQSTHSVCRVHCRQPKPWRHPSFRIFLTAKTATLFGVRRSCRPNDRDNAAAATMTTRWALPEWLRQVTIFPTLQRRRRRRAWLSRGLSRQRQSNGTKQSLQREAIKFHRPRLCFKSMMPTINIIWRSKCPFIIFPFKRRKCIMYRPSNNLITWHDNISSLLSR
jgi:hypothetical protein